MIGWESHRPHTPRTRVTETSCCGIYEWCSEGGRYFVLRQGEGGYEETGRGLHADARPIWDSLVQGHRHGEEADVEADLRARAGGGSTFYGPWDRTVRQLIASAEGYAL